MFRDIWRLIRGEDQRARKVRWMLGLLRPYRKQVILMSVALVIATAAALAPPYLAGLAIDDGIQKGDAGALAMIVGVYIASVAILWAATYAQTYFVGWVGQRALQDLRERIYSHLQRMSIGFFTRRKPGVLISRLTNDVQALDTLVTDGVITLFQSTLTLRRGRRHPAAARRAAGAGHVRDLPDPRARLAWSSGSSPRTPTG